MISSRLSLVLLSALLSLGATQGPAPIALPSNLAAYKTWVPLLKEAQPVPVGLWIRCAQVTAADWEEARKEHGPHTHRYIRVYGNPTAAEAMARAESGALPYGSIIAKEKLAVSPEASADGVGFMIRHAPPAFASTDGWEFVFAPSSGDQRETHQACAACHRNAPGHTYVFGTYPVSKSKRRADRVFE
jgi:hypothetical protein